MCFLDLALHCRKGVATSVASCLGKGWQFAGVSWVTAVLYLLLEHYGHKQGALEGESGIVQGVSLVKL